MTLLCILEMGAVYNGKVKIGLAKGRGSNGVTRAFKLSRSVVC